MDDSASSSAERHSVAPATGGKTDSRRNTTDNDGYDGGRGQEEWKKSSERDEARHDVLRNVLLLYSSQHLICVRRVSISYPSWPTCVLIRMSEGERPSVQPRVYGGRMRDYVGKRVRLLCEVLKI